jgi:subtilisin family serine protease
MDGTSMATPHVAGLAALLLEAKPTATTDELEKAILDSCALPPTMPDFRANRGVPDAASALALLTGGAQAALPRAALPQAPPPTTPSAARRKPRRKAVA